ncbi:MAG: 5-(carboxyamino)imidazole ribonucleotide mutase [bacterium]|nr:5-(carboxyamino)imidazole ribonucleotide mutase [bacterium]
MAGRPRVAVLMGSDSDWPTMEKCADLLADLGLEASVEVMSAHRTPVRVHEFARGAHEAGFEVLIAAAGLAAGLAGTVAANTTLPVIGVPIASGSLQGVDALLSTVQMPPGVPVATVGIGEAGAKNAALLAAQIIGRHDPQIDANVRRFKEGLVEGVERKSLALQEKLKAR